MNRKQILSLPPIEKEVVKVELTEGERLFYNALLDKSQAVFEGFVSSGTASKSWFAIFSLLQRLRQACDHLSLTVRSHVNPEEKETQKLSADVKQKGETPPVNKRYASSKLNDKVSPM